MGSLPMKIIQLEYFSAVCRYHSITQAAQKLYVTQPAISNAIRELEKEFSISLFSRTKNHMVLTKEGEEFYQKAIMTFLFQKSALFLQYIHFLFAKQAQNQHNTILHLHND